MWVLCERVKCLQQAVVVECNSNMRDLGVISKKKSCITIFFSISWEHKIISSHINFILRISWKKGMKKKSKKSETECP